VVGTCECGNEHSGSTKCGELQLRSGQLLKKDSAPWSKLSKLSKLSKRDAI